VLKLNFKCILGESSSAQANNTKKSNFEFGGFSMPPRCIGFQRRFLLSDFVSGRDGSLSGIAEIRQAYQLHRQLFGIFLFDWALIPSGDLYISLSCVIRPLSCLVILVLWFDQALILSGDFHNNRESFNELTRLHSYSFSLPDRPLEDPWLGHHKCWVQRCNSPRYGDRGSNPQSNRRRELRRSGSNKDESESGLSDSQSGSNIKSIYHEIAVSM
jgi:hypothetical protein